MGSVIEMEGGCFVGRADRLKGTDLYLDFPSAGATQHLMCAATLADGVTTIQNAAMEPEVTSLAYFLKKMGARIEGEGTSTITIIGRDKLEGCEYRIPADRMQAGTYLLAGAATQGRVRVTGILPENLTALVQKLKDADVETTEGVDWIEVQGNGRPKGIRVKTMPHPGFPTDLQQPLTSLLTIASGPSWVRETIYESRIGHVQELNRMGADVRVQGETTYIEPVPKLRGAVVEASDLRAGAALVVAALAAEGETLITNVHFIDRGYANLEQTLQSIGANIVREDLDNPADSYRKQIQN
jgi:UDP-N-acetylglucosamine 1-carboxyvinyltransferase